jgi:hypothetical protein
MPNGIPEIDFQGNSAGRRESHVSQEYKSPARFKGGKILGVEVSVAEDSYLALEKEAAGALARD